MPDPTSLTAKETRSRMAGSPEIPGPRCRILTIRRQGARLMSASSKYGDQNEGRTWSRPPIRLHCNCGKKVPVERWFFTAFALAMIATSIAGFAPSIVHTARRRAPLSLLAAAHGMVVFAWLLIFLVQSRLVATRHVALHRRLGLAAVFVLALMIPLAYATSVSMVRRGFDLSGDLRIDHDPLYESIFPCVDLTMFSVLAIAALAYRRRPEIHKRLMLFANITLMPAALAHFIGHTPRLASLPAAIMAPISIFLMAAVARDYLVARRVRALTLGLAILLFVSGPLRAGLIGPSAAWHQFARWLTR